MSQTSHLLSTGNTCQSFICSTEIYCHIYYVDFCRATLCVMAHAVVRCLSVRLSVCPSVRPSRSCIEASKRILKLFHRLVAPPLHFSLHFDGGVEGIRNMKESRFSTNISLYIGSDTRYGHSRLQRLNLITLELRRLHIDLVWCYKTVFGLVDVKFDDFFKHALLNHTRGHTYKLYFISKEVVQML